LQSRIIFIRQSYTPYGGGELILDRMLAALTQRNIKVAILARAWPQERRDIEFIRCDPLAIARPFREILFARTACRRIATETAALVQSHERIPCCDVYRAGDGVHAAYLDARLRTEPIWGRAAIAASLYHRNILRLERKMFASPRLKAVIVNSTMVADEIVKYYGFARERIHLVANGIDLARFRPQARVEHRAAVRKKLGVADGQPVALFVGSGYRRKGLSYAIGAVAHSHAGAELWVIGRDGLGTRLRLLGPQTDPLPYFAAADVLVLPSIYDPFPSTALEALATGLPVVTSTGCGARDVAARLDPALVRDTLDIEGLAAALDRAFALAADPATAHAARAIASGYGIDTMVDRMLALYSTLVPELKAGAA